MFTFSTRENLKTSNILSVVIAAGGNPKNSVRQATTNWLPNTVLNRQNDHNHSGETEANESRLPQNAGYLT